MYTRRTRPIAMVAAALVAAQLAVPAQTANAANPATVEAELAAVTADLLRVLAEQRDGPAPIDDQAVGALTDLAAKAEANLAPAPCDSAANLVDLSGGLRDRARWLRERLATEDFPPDDVALLQQVVTGLDRADRGAAAVRARIFSEIKRCEGPVDIVVDPGRVQPRGDSLPSEEPGVTRPLAGLVDTDGVRVDFVATELVLSTSDAARLDAFVAVWGGTVVRKVEFPGDLVQYLVRIDTGRADPRALSEDLASLSPGKARAESMAVSSEEGLRLLAAAASAARDGFTVGVNWVSEPTGFGDGDVREAAQGLPGVVHAGYNRNVYTWDYLRSGSVQDIGVTSAWTVLHSLGRMNNKVPMAILDQGFVVTSDMPSGTALKSSFPLIDPAFSYPWEAPWHGTQVASIAASVPGNFTGIAGTAGTTAQPTGIWTTMDIFYTSVAIAMAYYAGNKLINMSFITSVPWSLEWAVWPFDQVTERVRNHGVLLFSAAGNEGIDVDDTFLGWETVWYSPCENDGVICVGGLGRNSRDRHVHSNWGHEHVDIFAPYDMLVGPTPAHPDGSDVKAEHGTSLASPYAMGVAALIWAADPSASADTVEQVLLRTRRPSPDGKVGKKVIHALGAVQDILPATVEILSPQDGSTVSPFQSTTFTAAVFSDGHGTPTITWRRNGIVFGTGTTVTATLPAGNHTVTAHATFPDGASAADTIHITSKDHAPQVQLVSPWLPNTTPPVFQQSELIPFRAITLDDLGPLPDNRVAWYLDGSNTPFATGHEAIVNTGAAPGYHTITVQGCDTAGQCSAVVGQVFISPDGTNQPPSAKITNPANGAMLWVNDHDASGYFHEITLAGTVTDPEGAPVSVTWLDNGVPIADTLNPTVRLAGGCGYFPHNLVLRVTDNAGVTRHDKILVTVNMVC